TNDTHTPSRPLVPRNALQPPPPGSDGTEPHTAKPLDLQRQHQWLLGATRAILCLSHIHRRPQHTPPRSALQLRSPAHRILVGRLQLELGKKVRLGRNSHDRRRVWKRGRRSPRPGVHRDLQEITTLQCERIHFRYRRKCPQFFLYLDATDLLTSQVVHRRLRRAAHPCLPHPTRYPAWSTRRFHSQEAQLHYPVFQYRRNRSHRGPLPRIQLLIPPTGRALSCLIIGKSERFLPVQLQSIRISASSDAVSRFHYVSHSRTTACFAGTKWSNICGSVVVRTFPISAAGSDGRRNTCLEFTRRSLEA